MAGRLAKLSRALAWPDARRLGRLLVDAGRAWVDDRCASMGAALAYYTAFSLAPLLLIVLSVASLAFGAEAARGEVFGQIRGLVGDAGAQAIESLLQSTAQPAKGIAGTLISLVLIFIGATTVFAELQASLDKIWRSTTPAHSGVWALLRARVLSLGLILGLGFLLLVSSLLSAGLHAAQTLWTPAQADADRALLMQGLNTVLSLALTTLLFATIYKWMPRERVAWRDVWFGALFTAVLFNVGNVLIGMYLGGSGISSAFGAAGSLVVVLVWVYYSAQVVLYGAQVARLHAESRQPKPQARADDPPPLRAAA